jgi:hypothetical protein
MIGLIESDKQGVKGSWEAYKLVKTVELAEYNGNISGRANDIKQKAKDYVYTMSGVNIYGISEKDIKQEIRTYAKEFANIYLDIQVNKINFMNEETASLYVAQTPLIGRWSIIDTFIKNAEYFIPNDNGNPNDTRWMRKYYFDQFWPRDLEKILTIQPELLSTIDEDEYSMLLSNNYEMWLTVENDFTSPEDRAIHESWSGPIFVDIGIATGLVIVGAEAAPAVVGFGTAVAQWLFALKDQFTSGMASASLPGFGTLQVPVADAQAISAEALNVQVAIDALTLEASRVLAATGGPEFYCKCYKKWRIRGNE